MKFQYSGPVSTIERSGTLHETVGNGARMHQIRSCKTRVHTSWQQFRIIASDGKRTTRLPGKETSSNAGKHVLEVVALAGKPRGPS